MQVPREYAKAYVEVLEVIKKLKPQEYIRIPKEKVDLYKKCSDKNYKFQLDERKMIKNQIREETKAILANLFEDYIDIKNCKK